MEGEPQPPPFDGNQLHRREQECSQAIKKVGRAPFGAERRLTFDPNSDRAAVNQATYFAAHANAARLAGPTSRMLQPARGSRSTRDKTPPDWVRPRGRAPPAEDTMEEVSSGESSEAASDEEDMEPSGPNPMSNLERQAIPHQVNSLRTSPPRRFIWLGSD